MSSLVLSASSVSAYLRCHHAYLNDATICLMGRKRIPLADLFWRHVNKTDQCWIWTASQNGVGYGRMARHADGPAKTKTLLAHRISWELAYGDVPVGHYVSHTCDNRLCVRPDHLRLLTHSERGHEGAHLPDRDAIFPWSRVRLPEGCWEWTGALTHGYGNVRRQAYSDSKAHRLAWQMAYGPIPEGMQVLHHCDNRKCVRPDHLFLGTAADNLYDMLAKGRAAWQRTSS